MCCECPVNLIKGIIHVGDVIYFTDDMRSKQGVWQFSVKRPNSLMERWNFTFKKAVFIPFHRQDINSFALLEGDGQLMVVLGYNNISYVNRLTSSLRWETLQGLDGQCIRNVVYLNNELIIMRDLNTNFTHVCGTPKEVNLECWVYQLLADSACFSVDVSLIGNRKIYSFTLV